MRIHICAVFTREETTDVQLGSLIKTDGNLSCFCHTSANVHRMLHTMLSREQMPTRWNAIDETHGHLKARHHFTHCFANLTSRKHSAMYRQKHHTTTPAAELLTTGNDGGPERIPHSSAPPLPLSNLKKPNSPQDVPQEFFTFQ